MQLLIVHRDAEIGAQLVQMVKDYTAHECDLVAYRHRSVRLGGAHMRDAIFC